MHCICRCCWLICLRQCELTSVFSFDGVDYLWGIASGKKSPALSLCSSFPRDFWKIWSGTPVVPVKQKPTSNSFVETFVAPLHSSVWWWLNKGWGQATGWCQCFGFCLVVLHHLLGDRKGLWPTRTVCHLSPKVLFCLHPFFLANRFLFLVFP